MSRDYNKEKRILLQTCRGLANDETKFRYSVADGKKCCFTSHTDMENYTDEIFKSEQQTECK